MLWVISGTGTGIGKTWVTCALARELRLAGVGCAAVKPVESGGAADGCALAAASAFHVQPSPYIFDDAVSPHLASRRAGVPIDLQVCRTWVERETRRADHVLVELAGGLLTPLSAGLTNLDLLEALHPDGWIAVAPDRLGVLHEVAALLVCAGRRPIPAPLVVLNEPEDRDLSTGTNAAELAAVRTCEVVATFPRARQQAPATLEAAAMVVRTMNIL